MQTLSRLNRAYSGLFGLKDTTFVLDFLNEADEVLEAFRTYYATAMLEDVTDPNLVYNLRVKLDATGHYDEFEVDRVAAAEMNPQSKPSDLVRAQEPVANRLTRSSARLWRDGEPQSWQRTVIRQKTLMRRWRR